MSEQLISIIVYTLVAVVAGAGEYFHLVPVGTFGVVLGGILGHNISIASTQTTADKTAQKVVAAVSNGNGNGHTTPPTP